MFTIIAALILSSGAVENYKELKSQCRDFSYAYTRGDDPTVYVSIRNKNYKTKYGSLDMADTDIKHQCNKGRR